ncbi:MAG: isoprenylcysteine carboxylmethyltransferase family protein [Bacilli bacterium]|nr:isoprenylcysteine carboxylmethyltransferase family protein [Bacilli bacterium]
MDMKLFAQAIIKYICGVIIVGLLIFIPAGSFNYINGWLFMGLLFIPMFIAGIIMFFTNPELLRSRLNAKEKETEQKEVVLLSGLMFIIGFVLAGLNYKYNWMNIPDSIVIIASIVFIIAYLLYAEVLRENTFLSRTIEVKDDQKVVDTGLYGIVRHPMYSITIILFLMIPIILRSPISFIVFLMYPFIIIKRVNNEEKVLEKDLKGYKDYQKRVKYKLIPFIW